MTYIDPNALSGPNTLRPPMPTSGGWTGANPKAWTSDFNVPPSGMGGGSTGLMAGAGTQAITGPIPFNDWFNQQQSDPNASNSWDGPNQYAHQAYDQYAQYGYLDGQVPLGDPRSLPPGFMQSAYGPAYRGVLNNPSGTYDSTEDPNHVRDWLRNAVPQFNAGRSFQDWSRSMDSSDNSGISGIIGNIGMAAAGVLSGGLTNAGIAAINSQPMSPSSVPYNPPPASPGGTPGGSVPNSGSANGSGVNGGLSGAIPGLLGGAASLAGSNEAIKAYEEAQRQAEAAGRFQPYNVFSGVGSTTFGPGGATSSLSPQYQGLRNQYLGNANAGAAAAGAFDPRQASNDLYGQLQAQAAPGEAEQRANAIAQIQGMGTLGLGVGADTGAGPANPLYSSLLKAQADAGRQRQISAYGMAQDTANQMQQRALGWGGAGLGLDQSQLQQQQLGLYGGGLQANSALGGARLAQGPIMAQGLTRGGILSGLGGALSGGPAGSNGVMTYLQRLLSGGGGGIPGLPGAPPNFNGTGVDQYGNPIGGNYSGGDPSQYGDQGGNWDPNTGLPYGSGGMSSFDPGVDWSSLYG